MVRNGVSAAEASLSLGPHAGGASTGTFAAVLEFRCLFTQDIRRKQKRWKDGLLRYHAFNRRVMAYDEGGNFLGDTHLDPLKFSAENGLQEGDELALDCGSVLVQVAELIDRTVQDLSELVDKRVKEREARMEKRARMDQEAAKRGHSAATPGVRVSGTLQNQHQPALAPARLQLQRVSLTRPKSPRPVAARAVIPTESPFELRQRQLQLRSEEGSEWNDDQEGDRPSKRRRPGSASLPPSKEGYARSLFGQALTLSSQPLATPVVAARMVGAYGKTEGRECFPGNGVAGRALQPGSTSGEQTTSGRAAQAGSLPGEQATRGRGVVSVVMDRKGGALGYESGVAVDAVPGDDGRDNAQARVQARALQRNDERTTDDSHCWRENLGVANLARSSVEGVSALNGQPLGERGSNRENARLSKSTASPDDSKMDAKQTTRRSAPRVARRDEPGLPDDGVGQNRGANRLMAKSRDRRATEDRDITVDKSMVAEQTMCPSSARGVRGCSAGPPDDSGAVASDKGAANKRPGRQALQRQPHDSKPIDSGSVQVRVAPEMPMVQLSIQPRKKPGMLISRAARESRAPTGDKDRRAGTTSGYPRTAGLSVPEVRAAKPNRPTHAKPSKPQPQSMENRASESILDEECEEDEPTTVVSGRVRQQHEPSARRPNGPSDEPDTASEMPEKAGGGTRKRKTAARDKSELAGQTGPRLAKLSRKGIRSKEIFGCVIDKDSASRGSELQRRELTTESALSDTTRTEPQFPPPSSPSGVDGQRFDCLTDGRTATAAATRRLNNVAVQPPACAKGSEKLKRATAGRPDCAATEFEAENGDAAPQAQPVASSCQVTRDGRAPPPLTAGAAPLHGAAKRDQKAAMVDAACLMAGGLDALKKQPSTSNVQKFLKHHRRQEKPSLAMQPTSPRADDDSIVGCSARGVGDVVHSDDSIAPGDATRKSVESGATSAKKFKQGGFVSANGGGPWSKEASDLFAKGRPTGNAAN